MENNIVKSNQKNFKDRAESKILDLLSDPVIVEKKLPEIFYKLNVIYRKYPRHSYSMISEIISLKSEYSPEYSDFIIHSCEFIIKESKESLKNKFEPETITYLCEKIEKIKDHVNLEEFRSEKESLLIKKIDEAQTSLAKTQNEWNKSKKTIDKNVKKLKKSEFNIITSLGILISIVLTMTGILSILGSSLQNISTVSIVKLILILLVIGFIFINLLFILFYSISRVLDTDFIQKCPRYEKNSCDDCKKKCCSPFITRNGNILLINILFIILIIFTFIYGTNYVENFLV